MTADERRKLLAQVHIAKKWAEGAVHMDEDAYRGLVAEIIAERGIRQKRGAKPSSAALDETGLRRLLACFRDLGWDGGRKPGKEHPRTVRSKPGERVLGRTYGRYAATGREGGASQKQLDYLAKLEDDLGWTGDPKRLARFITRQAGGAEGVLTLPESMSRALCTKVITGLERLTGEKPYRPVQRLAASATKPKPSA